MKKIGFMKIDAKGMPYKDLNERIHQLVDQGEKEIVLENINGQRYIGDGISKEVKIVIHGTPGNDLGAFMNGATLEVFGNAQDGIGNTMNAGKILVHGNVGDIVGHAMRGGKIFIQGNVGYRTGIHMKAYHHLNPVIVAGGCAQDFLGEYMAGGIIILLGSQRDKKRPVVGNYCATGMHGGSIYIRGQIENYQIGKEVKVFPLNDDDSKQLEKYLTEYAQALSLEKIEIHREEFCKLMPYTHRPYGKLYAY